MQAFGYMNCVSRGILGVKADMVRAFSFLRQELDDIGTAVNAVKTVAIPPRGHTPRRPMRYGSCKALTSALQTKAGWRCFGFLIGAGKTCCSDQWRQ